MSRLVIIGILSVVLVFLAFPAFAVDPAQGTYTSVDIGFGSQDVLTGRGTNSRPVSGGIGNVFNTGSWDGVTLDTQWIFTCGISVSQDVVDNRVSGTGTVVFTTIYGGGTFVLDKAGPWANSGVDFSGTMNALTRITTLQYVNGTAVAAVENINTSGKFDKGSCLLEFVINNGVGLGDTDSGTPLPADFPPFLDSSCGALPSDSPGSWGDVKDIILAIVCPVPVHETTWGQVKALYK